jgi:PAS domain-containing protein
MNDFDDALVTASAAIVVDRRGYVVGWNEGAETLLGYSATDVVGRACHHVLCGRRPDGDLVCHPWCPMAPIRQRDVSDDKLVLYPRSASREMLRLVLSVFRVGGQDPARGWIVHVITSVELLPAKPHEVSPRRLAWPPPRHTTKPKPPDRSQH